MRIETPDVVVVGLGPAGSSAAAAAARGGVSVVALERRAQAGRPVQCAEFVPAMLDQEIPGLAIVTTQLISRMRTYVENGSAEETPQFPGRMIDRAAFDRRLAEAAAEAGVDCRYGSAVRGIESDGTVSTVDETILRPRLLIGADGPLSRVGAAIGEINRELVETRQITVPLCRASDATDIFLRSGFVGGYAWLFPKGPVANLGLGVSTAARQRLKPLLAKLHKDLTNERQVGDEAICHTGGAIPVGGPLRAIGWLGRVPVLLAGDALGLTNPITGAGIASAVLSGRLAGESAAAWLAGQSKGLGDYEEELHDLFVAGLARALRRRHALWGCDGRLGNRETKPPSPTALRKSWITYPQYWAD